MGWSFTWFLANSSERGDALHGWKMPTLPTAAPKRKVGVNPFTHEEIVVWEYASPPTPAAEPDADIPDYEELPHFRNRMDFQEFGTLLHVLTGRDAAHLSCLLDHLKLNGPEDLESQVHYVPADLVAALAAATADLNLAQRWTAINPQPERWQGDEAVGRQRWLEAIVELACTAVATQREMFVHWQI